MSKVKENVPESKSIAAPMMEPQPTLPEKQPGLARVGSIHPAAALPPPNGRPPAAWAGEMMAGSAPGVGAIRRAQMATGLQQTVGNARISRMLGTAVQTKLTVGAPNDPYEQEADRVATQVVSQNTSFTQLGVQRQVEDAEPWQATSGPQHCPECNKKLQRDPSATFCPSCAATLQRQATSAATPEVTPEIENQINTNRGNSQTLTDSVRAPMEQVMGADFSGVRVHTDSTADHLNRSLNARAFTTGHDIFLRQGEYNPSSRAGQELLAHELTHVVQQDGEQLQRARTQAKEEAATGGARSERENGPVNSPSTDAKIRRASTHVQLQETPSDSPVSAEDLIDEYTTLNFLDEEGLGRDLARRLPRDAKLVDSVLNELSDGDRDDVTYEITIAAAGKLGGIEEALRMRFVRELAGGFVSDDEEGAIAAIWISFENMQPQVAERNRELWKKSLWESDQLVEYVKPIGDSFSVDVIGLANAYLAQNKQVLYTEAQRYGIDLQNKQSVAPTHPDYLESVRPIAKGVLTLKKQLDEFKEIRVGYNSVSDCLFGACRSEAWFNPEHRPGMDPDKTESPPWPTWEEVKVQYDRVSAVISAFANMYPTIYLLIQQDKLEALDQAGDAAKAQNVIHETLEKTDEKIGEAADKITSGKISYYDLKLIQIQLFEGLGRDVFEPQHPWNQPYYQDIANDDIKGHEARQFWVDLGLSLAAAAALIAAPFTGGASAAFLVGFGVGIGAVQAGMSWDKYLSLSTLSDAKTKDELALVSQGEVSAQLVDVIIQTVAVFLDVYGAKAATTAARTSREALEVAEKGLKEQLAEETRKRMLREAGKDIGMTGAGAGVAIGMHELADDEPVPDMQATAGQWQINLGPEQPDTAPADVNRMVIQRAPGPGGPPPAPAAKQPILLTGGEFEIYVEKALLKGDWEGLPQMSFVIPGQYTGSGWGIDRIGIVFDETTGLVDVYHLEMKFVAPGSPFVPELGQRAVGTQTGGAWTKKAVDSFLNSQHPKARAGKERLRRALQKMHPGEAIDIERMRSFLDGKLVGAPVRVVIPHWADFSKLYKQVAALVRAGREIRIVKVFGRK
jgi:hypothetical protein